MVPQGGATGAWGREHPNERTLGEGVVSTPFYFILELCSATSNNILYLIKEYL